MHKMYTDEHAADDNVAFSFYYRVFRSLNLKFTRPKKDLCGICEGYRRGTDVEKVTQRQEYERHIQEKLSVREIKKGFKDENNEKRLVASFDLQHFLQAASIVLQLFCLRCEIEGCALLPVE